MIDWQRDKKWSDRFIPEIKHALAEHLIGEAPEVEDMQNNTDLVVLTMNPIRVACRVRKHKYFSEYPNEFTLRSGRPAGTKTELAKVVEGWGDYIFYGFADESEMCLVSWLLGSLNCFRLWFMSSLVKNDGKKPGKEHYNDDGTSFVAYDWRKLPNDFVVARSNNV